MAKVMIIAGGMWQCPIVKLAKRLGHYVICVNLYPDSPAFKYADAGLVADVLDKEKILGFAKQYSPDAVLTDQTDIAVPTVAYVAGQMGVRGITEEIAERFTNKHIMRELTDKAGFLSPQYALCRTPEEVKEFIGRVGKSIIKPLDSQSSRGCHIVKTDGDADAFFWDCIRYSNAEEAVVIEEYIEGTEFTVDGLKTEDGYIVTAISEKEHYSHNPNIAKRLLFLQDNDRYDYGKLRELNKDMVLALGLPFGMTHSEYKYRDGAFYLIEIAARGGGSRISSDIVPIMSGINSNEVYLKMLLGEKAVVHKGVQHACSVLGFFDLKAGRVAAVSGLEEAKCLKGVVCIGFEVDVGDTISNAQDDRSRCGYYILYADSVEELHHIERKVKDTIKVEIVGNE